MAVMMIVQSEFLLAMRGIVGVIKIQRDAEGRFAVTGNELLDQCGRYPVDVTRAYRAFQTGVRRATGQCIAAIQRRASRCQFEHRVIA